MAATYPSSIVAFSTKSDGAGNFILAAHMNAVQDEIAAIETGLIDGFAHIIKPGTDSAFTLGTSGVRWSVIYGDLFDGSGASLTALNATQLTSGTVPDARFPATLPALSGVNLTALNASNLASGTVPIARMVGADPGADRIIFWDDSAGVLAFLTLSGASITDTTLTISSPKPIVQWTALGNMQPASSAAPFDVRNDHPVLDFDDASTESAMFGGVLPTGYAGGGLTIEIYWTATSATTGDVRWGAAIERMNTDLDSGSFASNQTTDTTCNGTSGIIAKTTITMTDGAQMDSLAAGEAFRLRIQRIGANAADTMTGDAELHRVVLRET